MNEQQSLMEDYRVLDLTDEKGLMCGKILGDLGADVIKVEKPGGDPARNRGPFYKDIPDPEKSLYWFYTNSSKRGITLNIESADGKEIFKRLVKSVDFVIESFKPGYMDSLGLGYSVLEKLNPGIICLLGGSQGIFEGINAAVGQKRQHLNKQFCGGQRIAHCGVAAQDADSQTLSDCLQIVV